MTNVYGDHSERLERGGWGAIPVQGKFPPVSGATGRDGTVTPDKMASWRNTHAHWNVAIRHDGTIAIDVDHYGSKTGADTLAEYEARLGKLPRTWRSTARGKDSLGGQFFFAVTADDSFVSKIGSDIDIIQHDHRYSMVSPSIHPNGQPYRWITPAGEYSDDGPTPYDLPDLPQAWVDELTRAPQAALLTGVTVVPWRALAESFIVGDDACLAAAVYAKDVDEADHIGHDEAMRFALRGFMLGREGHSGVGKVLDTLYGVFSKYIGAQPGRDPREPDNVFRDMADLAQRKVVADVCRCPVGSEISDDDLTGVDDPNLPIYLAMVPPLIVTGRGPAKLHFPAAAAQFCHVHPVRRQSGSQGATYVWDGSRWIVDDVKERVYRWSAKVLSPDEWTPNKARELADYILMHAPQVDERDINTQFISVKNGLLDWRTGELRPRTKDVFVVNHIPHNWRPDATPGRFREWIESAIEPSAQQAIWEVLGYAVSPVHDLKSALACTGPGGGGKSTFINVLTQLVGAENATAMSPNEMSSRFNKAELFGKTLNAAGDVGAETLKNLGFFKSVVAADVIQGEFKGRDPFRFRPNAFHVAAFNMMPSVEQNDSAFWDRWAVLPFEHRFNRNAPDNFFRDVMPYDTALMEGVLVGAVRGLQSLRDRGRFDPEVFTPAKEVWRSQVDSVAAFVAEHIDIQGDAKVSAGALHGLYMQVTNAGGETPLGRNKFYGQFEAYMADRFPKKMHVLDRSGKRYLGVRAILDGDINGAAQLYGERGYIIRPA